MKKKLFLLMALLCCFVLAVGILAACNGDDPDDLGEPGDEDVITYGSNITERFLWIIQ